MHLIGLMLVWISAAALTWVALGWAPSHIHALTEQGAQLPGLTVMAFHLVHAMQTWWFVIAGAMIAYTVVHLAVLRAVPSLVVAVALTGLFAVLSSVIWLGITLPELELAKQLH
jgi:type II secretory pathway component PulF